MIDGPKIANNFNCETFIAHTFFAYFAINNIISLLQNLSRPNPASEYGLNDKHTFVWVCLSILWGWHLKG